LCSRTGGYARESDKCNGGSQARTYAFRLRELRRPLYRSVALGKHTTGRLKQNSPLPFLLANAHVAGCGWLGIHEAHLQAFGFGMASF